MTKIEPCKCGYEFPRVVQVKHSFKRGSYYDYFVTCDWCGDDNAIGTSIDLSQTEKPDGFLYSEFAILKWNKKVQNEM